MTVHATFAHAIITEIIQCVHQACLWLDFHVYLCVVFGSMDMISNGINALFKRVCLLSKACGEVGDQQSGPQGPAMLSESASGFLFEHVYLGLVQNPLTAKWMLYRRTESWLFYILFILHAGFTPKGLRPHHVKAHTDDWHRSTTFSVDYIVHIC